MRVAKEKKLRGAKEEKCERRQGGEVREVQKRSKGGEV